MMLWVLSVVVATRQMDDEECTVCVVMRHHTSLLQNRHSALKVCRRGRHHLKNAPGILLCREKYLPFLLRKQEGIIFFDVTIGLSFSCNKVIHCTLVRVKGCSIN